MIIKYTKREVNIDRIDPSKIFVFEETATSVAILIAY